LIEALEYSIDTAKVIAQTVKTINYQVALTYSVMKGIKEFDGKGCQAAH
jgi:hypothetical protein